MTITLIIIAITAIVSFSGFSNAQLVDKLILWPPAVSRKKEYYRLASYGLIHADLQHLLFNMLTLFFFGRLMEQVYTALLGPFGFLVFYAGGLIVSILPSYLRNRNNSRYRSLGASGAVSAVLFAFILLQPWAKIIVFVVPMPAILYAILYVVYTFYMDRQGTGNINHSAHLWGAAYGVLATIVVYPPAIGMFFHGLSNTGY
ncbi:MAG: rhomboid family intramembrane serine protease [Rudaea sp.]